MKTPLIGVTMDCTVNGEGYRSNMQYMSAVESAGGLPVGLPYKANPALIPRYVDALDGVLFTGGDDLDPALYGEKWHSQAIAVDPRRQQFELALLAEVERRRLPALFVCLGCQLLNVHRGGSLVQFIPDLPGKLEHRKVGEQLFRHAVTLESDSLLGAAIGKLKISTNSYHKQAVKRLGRGLRVVATAPDGIIEGLEDPTFPLLAAVQWHPERLCDEEDHLAVFKLLVNKAQAGRRA